ncbi:MAG: tyrosine-protein phosphatase [Pseudomonadota bacterium]
MIQVSWDTRIAMMTAETGSEGDTDHRADAVSSQPASSMPRAVSGAASAARSVAEREAAELEAAARGATSIATDTDTDTDAPAEVVPDKAKAGPQSSTRDPRAAKRKRRRKRRWLRPLDTPRKRLNAWANMLLVDHGIFRALYSNTWVVSPRMWRSAQPLPRHIRRFARAGGRTVVSLRGGFQFGSLPLETEACAAEGLDFQTIVLRSRGLPKREELLAILDRLDAIATPALFHCKSGADRAGFMSAIWLLYREGAGIDAARAQLSIRYGHFRRSKTGVLDAFIESYAADGGPTAMPLRRWVETRYDPEAIRAAFRPAGLASLIADGILQRE